MEPSVSPALKELAKNPDLKKLIDKLTTQLGTARSKDPTSPTVRGKKTDQAPEREGHAGRRGDILEEFHKSGTYDGKKLDAAPLILKVSIAGSGCVVMASQEGKKADKTLAKIGGGDKTKAPAAFSNDKGDVTFSGPQAIGGASDTGENSINELVAKVPTVIRAAIPEETHAGGKNVILLIKAHSRGAVAAGLIAKKIKADFPAIAVELVQFDPVPGQMQKGDREKVDVSELDQSTLVCSIASGYGYLLRSFRPQLVHGAKRIIVSRQEHGGGAKKGYDVDGKRYTGSRINSLPPGAYYETAYDKKTEVGTLERMSKDRFKKQLQDVYDHREATIPDTGRWDRIVKEVDAFFKRSGG